MTDGEPKKYGLILPKKDRQKTVQAPILKKASIFDNDDDESEGPNSKSAADARRKDGNKSLWKKETQLTIQKALEEDPTAFEYDNVFDQMTEKKAEMQNRTQGGVEKEKDRKPKYVQSLIAAAKEREREFDRRQERKVQRERETENGEFAEKEAFVTSSYKKKMQEMRQQEAKEKEEARVEALLDVTKQKDLSGFYRHFLKQKTGEEKVRNAGDVFEDQKKKSAEVFSVQEKKSAEFFENKKTKLAENFSFREKNLAENFPSSSKKREDEEEVQFDSSKRQKFERLPEKEDNQFCLNEDKIEISVLTKNDKIEISEEISVSSLPEIVPEKDVFAKHTTEDSAHNARERYLARQAAKAATQT